MLLLGEASHRTSTLTVPLFYYADLLFNLAVLWVGSALMKAEQET